MSRNRQTKNGIPKINRAFLALPVDTIVSEELNALKSHSRWLYVIICTKFRRERVKKKDWYGFTYNELQEISKYDRRRLKPCIDELYKNDFFEVEYGGKNNPSRYRPVLKWLE